MSDDTQTLRTLLDKLEAHVGRGPHPNGSHAVWETERDVLIARVNAYSALVMHDTAETLKPPTFPREVARLIHGPLTPLAIEALRELVPAHYA